ncbi:helix-turn-helix transcriptional regulator [Sphingobacterium sp. SGG-5]|uniref:helix-turn-helix transcriptional regulator n=1 Tax=Sphingobacterium sp. SGG-5 TaxID=2710881 RepID=UPI0013ED4199|nr:AraC family transcriptional regulator [Sphingobacterium sp. SGG-5]NGM60878.1 helix-turn-helix transcriptional regulator [Sphingobacterium sp. SGG-5]
MTQDEKKATHSEITLQGCQSEIHYTILRGNAVLSCKSPIDGFINILYATGSGASAYRINNDTYVIRNGETILQPIKKKYSCTWKNLSEDTIIILAFIPSFMLGQPHTNSGEETRWLTERTMTKRDQRLSLVIKQILNLADTPHHLARLRIQSLFIKGLIYQLEDWYPQHDSEEIMANKSLYDRVQLARQMIEKDMAKNYTIHELAKAVGTNEQYLKKYFKQYIGKTVQTYMKEIKMEHAKNLIMAGEHRIADVARMTGYKHSTHFSTAFKKFFGFIPNALRYIFILVLEYILTEIDYLVFITAV